MHITSNKNDDGRTQTGKETEKHVHLLCLDRINQRLGAIEKIRGEEGEGVSPNQVRKESLSSGELIEDCIQSSVEPSR